MGILSPIYDASFDSTQFLELVSNNFYPGIDVDTDGTLYSHMGGTHTYIDMGRAPLIFEVIAGVEGAQKTSLLGKRGDTGTLVWSRGTHTATLLDITPTEADASGLDGNILTLKFFATSVPTGIAPAARILTDTYLRLTTDDGDYLTEA